MTSARAFAAVVLQATLAGVCLVALVAAARASSFSVLHLALVVLMFATVVARPAVGLAALGLLLPLDLALWSLLRASVAPALVAESLLVAFVGGAALNAAIRRDTLRDLRLGWPALAMVLIVSVSMACALLAHAGSASDAAREIGRHLSAGRLSSGSRVEGVEPSLRWIEVLALAAFAELAIRRAPAMGRVVLISWLAAGAGAAALSALYVLQAVMTRGEGVGAAVGLFVSTRISVLFPDVNAAGSLFALLGVTAIVLAVKAQQRLIASIAAPLTLGALMAAKSRAAIVASGLVLGAMAVWAIARSGRRLLAAGLAGTIMVGGAAFVLLERSTHVGAGAALESRIEMSRIALKITRDAPVFGVGAGRFVAASRDFLEPDFVASFPEAAAGENAHNNFLQVLAEFGLLGLIAFAWILWEAIMPSARAEGRRGAERIAIVAGLSAFLISALLGHPLLIFPIAVNFFLAVGLAAGLAPSLAPTPGRVPAMAVALVAVVLLSLPWRVAAALDPGKPDVAGAAEAPAPLDGVSYRVAEQVSHWRVRAHSRFATFALRWDAGARSDCRVRIVIDDRTVDEVTVAAEVWSDVRFTIPSRRRPSNPPEIELQVTSPECRLLVGPVTATR